jgi:hypothetical protein
MVRHRLAVSAAAAAFLLFFPILSSAQTGIIAGVVKDTTGAVLPGAIVEASSDALIEKVRTAATDGQGQYKIVDLRPGVYTVTVSLEGFSSVKREGIELTAGFTANVSADLRLGAVEETLTVTGRSPLVDVQNVIHQQVMTRDVVDALPTAKTTFGLAVLVPGVIVAGVGNGVSGQDIGGSVGDNSQYLSVHGSRGLEMPLLYDGMRYNNMNGYGGGYNTNFAVNNGSVQEVAVAVGSLSAESVNSGVRANVIPRDGGNAFKGFFLANFTNNKLEATNLTPRLESYGLTAIPGIDKMWDINPALGGPIRTDKLWFYGAYRYWGNYLQAGGSYYNKDPLAFAYVPDPSRPAKNETWYQSENLRLTWQATPKNKFSIFADEQQRCTCHLGIAGNIPPEAARYQQVAPNLLLQTTWNAPVTNKLLFDVGATLYDETWTLWPSRDPVVAPTTTAVQELSTNTTFRAATTYVTQKNLQFNTKAYVSYVTGSHAFKVGMQMQTGYRRQDTWTNNDISFQLLGGVPANIVQYTTPYTTEDHVKLDLGVFAQDQWTVNRLTLNLGLRFDYLNAYVPPQNLAAVQFVGVRDFAGVANVPNWKDIVPRLGASYDLFGNGKTAVKVSVGKYLQGITTLLAGNNNPIVTSVNSATRTWDDRNRDFVPDCDLKDLGSNGECGGISNTSFGKTLVTTTYDPAVLNGWGKRRYDWEVQSGVQHEVTQGLAVNATYTRHWYGNFLVTDNLLVAPSDYSSYCVAAPADARLPGGGGREICGFYDINPNRFGQVNNLVTFASNFGRQSEMYQGVDVSVNLRLPRGILMQGGTSTGRLALDNCDLVGKVDNPAASNSSAILASPSPLYCHVTPPLQTQVKLLGVYPLPWFGLMMSATFQSIPGPQVTASYVVSSAQVAQSLGRNLAAGPNGTATVQFVAPGTMFGDRLNQLDYRVTKTFTIGGVRAQGQVEMYNLLNVSPVLVQNNAYGSAWQQPTAVLPGRFVKFGIQLNF